MTTETFYGSGDYRAFRIEGRASTYAAARDYYFAYYLDYGNYYVGQSVYSDRFGSKYYCWRSFFRFDTSAIPDDAVISNVYLRFVITDDLSTTNFDVQIVEQVWSEDDYKQDMYANCLAATNYFLWRNTSGIATATYYNSPALTSTYVNKSGYTTYSLRSSRDKNGTAPTGNEYIMRWGYFNEPQLVVTYSIPTPSLPSIIWWS